MAGVARGRSVGVPLGAAGDAEKQTPSRRQRYSRSRNERTQKMRRFLIVTLLIGTLGLSLSANPASHATTTYDWPQFGSTNTLETGLTAGNVGQLRRVFRTALSDVADDAPI